MNGWYSGVKVGYASPEARVLRAYSVITVEKKHQKKTDTAMNACLILINMNC